MKSLLALFMLSVCAPAAFAAKSVPVVLKEGEKQFLGDLYLPKTSKGPLPLVVVIHEWWGKSEHPKKSAAKIADDLGYAALAVDLYGDAKTVTTPTEAQGLATPFYQNPDSAVQRLRAFAAAAPEAAKSAKVTLDMKRVSAVGFCFGGSQALNLARAGGLSGDQNLVGVVSFHGGLASSLKANDDLKAKILVLHGAADPMVKPDEVQAFKEEMKNAKADLTFVSFPGATHAFTNPKATAIGKKYGIPIAYNKKADQASWKQAKKFLKEVNK